MKPIKRKKSDGTLYLSYSVLVGTAFCPDCKKHWEDCHCRTGNGNCGNKSTRKANLDVIERSNMAQTDRADTE